TAAAASLPAAHAPSRSTLAGSYGAPSPTEYPAARSQPRAPQPQLPAAEPAVPPAPLPRLYARPPEQVGSIVEPQLQPLARRHHQAQRIVRRIVPADAGQPQTTTSPRQAAALDRIVLKHHQAVEQRPRSRQLLDLGEPKMLVRNQSRLAVLHLLEKLQQRLRRRQLDPQRERCVKQPPHALNAGNLRRPPRHRHPKHNVVTPAHSAKQYPPRHLHKGIERETILARLLPMRLAKR